MSPAEQVGPKDGPQDGRVVRREVLRGEVPAQSAGERLDQALAQMFPQHSRARLQAWIKEGQVQVNGRQLRPRDRVLGGEIILLDAEIEQQTRVVAQNIPLDVIFEDDAILVINKPAGLVVHPGAGNSAGTLQNALLHHCSALAEVPRAGLVHRLDKDTTGLLVVAKTLEAHTRLVAALQEREFEREYLALVNGEVIAGGTIDEPIGRHPVDRLRQAVRMDGRPATTHFRIAEKYRAHTLLSVKLETGRTHQIRVHLTHQRLPLVGDQVYGRRLRLPPGANSELSGALRAFRRQALHATKLGLEHPISGEAMSWEAPVPADLQQLLTVLRADMQTVAQWL